VVGVTFECDYPAAARTRRIVSTTALPAGLTPGEIDAFVRRRVAAGDDLYHLDAGALRELDPDVVITQDLCKVCAIDVDDVAEALDYLGCRAEVVSTDPHDLDEVLTSIETIGKAINRDSSILVEDLRTRLRQLSGRSGSRVAPVGSSPQVGSVDSGPGVVSVDPGPEVVSVDPSPRVVSVDPGPVVVSVGSRPRVALLEWTDPPYAPGHWLPEMVTLAGGTNVLGSAGQRSTPITWSAVADARPDVIVAAPCGFTLDGAAELTQILLDHDHLPPSIPVWAVDANGYFARPGPRLIDGIELLATLLHDGTPDPALARRLR
jgi:iron complex transport system substrate-binding protein